MRERCLFFIFQLGGLHSNAYISDLFAKNFAKDGMLAYVTYVQRKERELGTDVLTHQKACSLTIVDQYPVLISSP